MTRTRKMVSVARSLACESSDTDVHAFMISAGLAYSSCPGETKPGSKEGRKAGGEWFRSSIFLSRICDLGSAAGTTDPVEFFDAGSWFLRRDSRRRRKRWRWRWRWRGPALWHRFRREDETRTQAVFGHSSYTERRDDINARSSWTFVRLCSSQNASVMFVFSRL